MFFGASGCALPAPERLPEELVVSLQRDAERARELRFPRPVEAWSVPPTRLRSLLEEELGAAYPAGSLQDRARMQELLGLLPRQTDLRRSILDFQSEAVVGFYTPLHRRLYLVGRPERLDPGLRGLAVHELVHALQAVHSGLLEVLLGLEEHDDLAFALGALLEGDATWASYRHQERVEGTPPLSPAAVAADFSPAWAEAVFPATPRFLRESFVLLYPSGYRLVDGLVTAGGVAALDAAWSDPPLSSEELLHPERYLDPRQRRPLRLFDFGASGLGLAPDPACRSLGSNSFGELGLRVWAQERAATAAEAAAFAAGWDGDRAVVFACPQGSAFAWLVQLDEPAAARHFAGMARALAAGLWTEGRAGPVRVDSRGLRVLLSSGLGSQAREDLLERVAPRLYRDLAAFLAEHPEIGERARALRQGTTAFRAP